VHEQFHYQVFVTAFDTFTQEQLEFVVSLLHDNTGVEVFPDVLVVVLVLTNYELDTQHVCDDPEPAHEVLAYVNDLYVTFL
jgi:hypothetical protein